MVCWTSPGPCAKKNPLMSTNSLSYPCQPCCQPSASSVPFFQKGSLALFCKDRQKSAFGFNIGMYLISSSSRGLGQRRCFCSNRMTHQWDNVLYQPSTHEEHCCFWAKWDFICKTETRLKQFLSEVLLGINILLEQMVKVALWHFTVCLNRTDKHK